MKRILGLGLLVLTCTALIAAAILFWEFNSPRESTSTNGTTSPAAQNSSDAPKSKILEVAGDDRDPEEAAFEAGLKSRVELLIATASATDAQRIVAEVAKLPSSALPLLMNRINDGSLAPATTRPIADALDQNSVRLANALAFRKRMAWYRKNMLDRFDDYAEKSPAGEPARIAVHAAVRMWAKDPRASGDESMIIWREARAANEIG